MGVFKDSQQFYATVGALMDRAKVDPNIGPKIAKSGIVIQFRYSDPEAVTTINAKSKPTQPGAFVDVLHGPTKLTADVVMTMKADTSHAFWHGKVNLLGAIAKKDIVVQGPLPKVLKLLPAVEPLYKIYPVLLKEKGLDGMIVK
ncbi:MAG: SCP2 sterol-binding domain-containing protein [Anaerolineales bacterium]|nr:SCP2 sterol-binding domain-containing protein [Anaerolineales bacterium]